MIYVWSLLAIYVIGLLWTFFSVMKEPDSFLGSELKLRLAVFLAVIWPYFFIIYLKEKLRR